MSGAVGWLPAGSAGVAVLSVVVSAGVAVVSGVVVLSGVVVSVVLSGAAGWLGVPVLSVPASRSLSTTGVMPSLFTNGPHDPHGGSYWPFEVLAPALIRWDVVRAPSSADLAKSRKPDGSPVYWASRANSTSDTRAVSAHFPWLNPTSFGPSVRFSISDLTSSSNVSASGWRFGLPSVSELNFMLVCVWIVPSDSMSAPATSGISVCRRDRLHCWSRACWLTASARSRDAWSNAASASGPFRSPLNWRGANW